MTYPKGEPFIPGNDNGVKRWLRSPRGEFTANFALNIVLSAPDLVAPWHDPYLHPLQKTTQSFVTLSGVAAGTYLSIKVGTATLPLGGPASFIVVTATGIIFTVTWNAIMPPVISTIFNAAGLPDPYDRQRQLQPLP